MANPAISPATWSRLRELDATCDFTMTRRSTKPQPGEMVGARNYPRMWVVEISLQVDPMKRVRAEGPDLDGTVQVAVEQAAHLTRAL